MAKHFSSILSGAKHQIARAGSHLADSHNLVAVVGRMVWVYDLPSILAETARSPEELLAETEKLTGFGINGDRLIPIKVNGLVRVPPPASNP